MSKKRTQRTSIVFGLLALGILLLAGAYLWRHTVAVLEPQGVIATKERHLMEIAAILSAIVIIPVFALTFFIVTKYRAENTKAKRSPDWDHNRWLEFTWWAIPCLIIGILAVVTWQSTHELDPFKPISSSTTPFTVQVVALDWKWLFIYPKQHIASVNLLELPQNTPINFEITADAPMNSFWIPQLSGQIYAMPGMSTQLHLMASKTGDYTGSSANISGEGFAGMHFDAKVVSPTDFANWTANTSTHTKNPLNLTTYNQLAKPSQNNPFTTYSPVETNLYDTIVMKYMAPPAAAEGKH